MKVYITYKSELDPNNVQRTALLRHANCARFAYNWGLQRKQEVWWMNQLPVPHIKTPTAIDLHRELNVLKRSKFGWMYDLSKCAPQEALRDLDSAFKNFFEGRAKYPRFKSRRSGVASFRMTGIIRAETSHIVLPRVGHVRLKERGYLPTQGHILFATVSEHGGRWFASIHMQVERNDPTLRAGEPVGVDLGIHHLAVTSDGTVVENPRALARKQRKVARLSKKISRKKKGSANWEKAVKRLRRLDLRIACVRKDAINKATTMIARTKPIIVIESLRPQNLVREHKLARSLLDASFGEFIRQMEYKCLWYGSTLIKADPFYPSTKRCSSCGNVKAGMARSERTYSCQVCGFVMDRDLNAARNLASVAASSVETVNACGECVRPEEPSGCESGSGL